jgi:hypothetical protein
MYFFHLEGRRANKSPVWNSIVPLGQVKNDEKGRACSTNVEQE